MSERSIEHGGFVVDRVYDASPDRVFAAWSDPQVKARWFDGSSGEFELDFRVGGWERRRGMLPDGLEYTAMAGRFRSAAWRTASTLIQRRSAAPA